MRHRQQLGKGGETLACASRLRGQRRRRFEQGLEPGIGRAAVQVRCQIALDRQRLKLRWGPRNTKLRVQSFVFSSVAEARAAFFERVDDLEARGFLDGSAG